MARDIQTSLSAGELDPALHSHADLAKYRSGLSICENWFVLAQGGIVTRPGFRYISEIVDNSSVARVIPFQFNTEQGYALVFTDQAMRVVYDGGVALETAGNITGATQANPVAITQASHGYSTGDDVYIAGVAGMTELNGRFFRITVTGAGAYTLDGIDGSGFAAYSSGGTGSRVYTLATPYTGSDLFRLKYTQSADVMTLMHPDYQQRQLSRSGHANWSLSAITFASEMSPPVAGLTAAEGGTGTDGTPREYRYVVTSVNEDGDESVASAIQSVTTAAHALSATRYIQISWTTVAGAEYYNVYKENSTQSGIFGWIGEADEDGSPTFRDYNRGPDMSVTPPVAKNPFDGSDKYPSCGTYHQQRLMFGASNNRPSALWATRTADFDNMDVSRPVRADDAIEATLFSQQVNEIRHMISMDELVVLTSGGEWLVVGDQDGIITPANINFRAQGYRGSSHVRPVLIGDTLLFVQEKGTRVRDLKYTFETDRFSGDDITVLARHMFERHEIVDWCYAQEPFSIVWAVRDDGVLLSLTYLREHSIYAWCRHVTDGTFESVCAVSEGAEDVVYAIVRRTVDGENRRYVERMHTRFFDAVEDAFCVDAGLTYEAPEYTISGATKASPVVITATGHGLSNGDVLRIRDVVGMTELNGKQYKATNVAANTFELHDMLDRDVDGTGFSAYVSGGTAQYATTTITNLHHLEGEAVAVLADGNVVPGLSVSDGEIEMPNPASKVHVGLGYVCDFQTLEVSFASEVLQSRKKQVGKVSLRVKNSRGLRAGKDATSLFEFRERTPAMGYGDIPALTQELATLVSPGWTDYGRTYVRQADPLPAEVLAVIPEVVVSG